MTNEDDKRKKAHEEIVDISNGELFLRIVALEREVQGLKLQLAEIAPKADHAYLQTMRIGGGS
jgi:hypothetical protein